MTITEIERALSYTINYSRWNPEKSPATCMDFLCAVAPIKREDKDFEIVYYDFLRWWFTKRDGDDVASRSRRIIGMNIRLSRISSDDSDVTGNVTIDGITYDLAILRSVIYDLLFNGLIKTIDK